jgi:uncharacterized protein YjdB
VGEATTAFLTGSQSSRGQAGRQSGTITIRVPSERFQEALAALRGVGTLRSETVNTQDVTKEYADLETRLVTKRATADRLVQVESLYAMFNPKAYPQEEFYEAWRNAILYDEHTWGAHNSISRPDDPFVKTAPTLRPTATPKPTPSNPYLIYVSKDSYTIAILGLDSDNEYTRVVRLFSTGIGRAGQTRAGTYTIESKERWHSWSGNAYSPYASRHSGGLYIHGPLYSAKDSNKMLPGSYNEIGTSCSSGCLRTTCSAAAWVYYNCPVGTKIIIANDSKYEVPHPARIDSNQTYDPTDPGASPEIPITGFSLGKTTVNMIAGETLKIAISNILPSDNTTEGFKYTSENADIASVSTSGTITAKGEGTVKIKVTANDVNGIYRTLTVTVVQPVTPTPEPSPSTEPTPTAEPTPEPTQTQPADPTPTPEQTVTPEPTVEPTPTPEPVPTPESTEQP